MKNGKSRGPDDISTDLIKLGGKDNITVPN